jgi:SpoIID/LytB domain protein
VVNVVSLEAYLCGVVAGEMAPAFPPEALKAQAMVSRTLFLNNFYRFHRGEDFDVCDEVHCQVYVGVTKQNETSSAAVNATRGLVLAYGDILCTASYSGVCGGHTEEASEVWEGDGQPYLQGDFDATEAGISSHAFDLKNENNVRLWIESKPKVFCNLEIAGSPSFASYATKYFRWQVRASRTDLEKWITEKTGTDIGELLDIKSVRRGSSGRLSEIQIVGSRDSVTVERELNIRRTLSATALYSACFVIDQEDLENGVAQTYVFSGAGWGHGVGMCQIGAAVRALRGQNAGQILAAYYKGTRIKKMY